MQQIAKQLQKVTLKETKIKVIIPDEFLDKVKFLCKMIPKVEWSGVLFYEVKGSIKRPDKMKLICKDILLMDKGSSAYTEYTFNEDVVAHQMENPELLEYRIGHIHSHNTMSTFFSGTDMSELNDNSPNHNFYFSLIVNNFMDTCAKVSFVGEANVENIKYSCKDEKGELYYIPGGSITKEVLFIYDCDVFMKEDKITVNQDFVRRFNEIEKQADIKAAQKAATYKGAISGPGKTVYTGNGSVVHHTGGGYQNNSNNSFNKHVGGNSFGTPYKPLFSDDETFHSQPFIADEETSDSELFTCYLMRLGNEMVNDDIENAIEDIIITGINITGFTKSLLDNYAHYYNAYFQKDAQRENPEYFMQILSDVIDVLEIYEEDYPDVLSQVIMGLKHFGNAFEKGHVETQSI